MGGAVEVLPDVTGIDRTFHYLVPATTRDGTAAIDVVPGTIVRIPLHGRRVRGFVVATDTPVPPGVDVQPLVEVVSLGPPPEVVELCRWTARRFSGRLRVPLVAASPERVVRRLPEAAGPAVPAPRRPVASGVPEHVAEAVASAVAAGDAVLRLPPAAERLPVVEAALEHADLGAGPLLVLVESHEDVDRLAGRLRRLGRSVACLPGEWAAAAAGLPDAVIGTRNAVFSPRTPSLTLVLDAHAEAYRSPKAPTFDARLVAAERARRAARPIVFVSPCPPLELLEDQAAPGRRLVTLPATVERLGWGDVAVVDSREEDPAEGGYPSALIAWIRREADAVAGGGPPVVCLLDRIGRARLLACRQCREVQRCPRCGAAELQMAKPPPGEIGVLTCPSCGHERPAQCSACGSARHRVARPGVSRAREQLEAVLGLPVGEMSGPRAAVPGTAVIVGTQVALHRVRRASLVVWLDFEQELLAPRFRAAEDSLALLARSVRLTGARASESGRVVVRTSLPGHEVVEAARRGDPGLVAAAEAARRRLLGLPPFGGLAGISGEGAHALVERLPAAVTATRLAAGDQYLLRGDSEEVLAGALSDLAESEPGGWASLGVRVEMNPLDV